MDVSGQDPSSDMYFLGSVQNLMLLRVALVAVAVEHCCQPQRQNLDRCLCSHLC